jgi:hypothetical protein
LSVRWRSVLPHHSELRIDDLILTRPVENDWYSHGWMRTMALDTIQMYLGVAVLRRSLAGVGLVLAAGSALLIYIKRVEEAETLARFGQGYAAYQQQTPYLLPQLAHQRDR